MKLYFATQNKHKFEEGKAILKDFEVEHLKINYVEDKELPIQDIAKTAAEQLANEHKKPIIVDDTGVFFTAYKDFPGANAKTIFNAIGYEGLLTLVAGKDRAAHFLTCIGFCLPGKKPKVFEGRMEGHISMMPFNLDKDVMPYERIFVPNKEVRTLSSMSREEKNKISHRKKAFEKLAAYLKKNPF